MQKIVGQVRRAIQDYDMISDGDRIAVGVSGGKDSLILLLALHTLQRFFPKKFELEAVSLTLGIGEFDLTPIKLLCENLEINYTIEETLIGKIIFEERKETNPCSLCANMRRGALHNLAIKLNCNKVALGHHRDDAIETLLLSTFYEGRIHTFSPVTYLDRKNLTMIRPMLYVEEKDIKTCIKEKNLQVVVNPCCANGKTKRQFIKEMVFDLERETHDIKSNLFGAIKRSGIDGWKA
jgi:tRNA 2-thiocytidine biosynthesis protein TtcA